jgi:hypothetical protein
LDATLKLPLLKETVRQMKLIPLPTPGVVSPRWRQLEEKEVALGVAERVIGEWNSRLSEWQRLYRDTKAGILARPGSKLKVFLLEEEEAVAPPVNTPGTQPLAAIFPKSDRSRAVAQAVIELGAAASAR